MLGAVPAYNSAFPARLDVDLDVLAGCFNNLAFSGPTPAARLPGAVLVAAGAGGGEFLGVEPFGDWMCGFGPVEFDQRARQIVLNGLYRRALLPCQHIEIPGSLGECRMRFCGCPVQQQRLPNSVGAEIR